VAHRENHVYGKTVYLCSVSCAWELEATIL
jgi:hypothetical protein